MSRQFSTLLPFVFAVAFGLAGHAEQLRVAIALPEVVADSDVVRKELEGEAALWQSLMTTELARNELFSVVEREDLSAMVREWNSSRPAATRWPTRIRFGWERKERVTH